MNRFLTSRTGRTILIIVGAAYLVFAVAAISGYPINTPMAATACAVTGMAFIGIGTTE